MIERIRHGDKELAIIVRNDFNGTGVHFLTDNNYSQQLAYMHHPKDKIIDAHIHNYEERNVVHTQEVLVIKRGVLRVDFYKDENCYIESVMLYSGDIVLLASGGHGFKVIEEVEMIEIKQGPYLGERDKTRFEGISDSEVKYRIIKQEKIDGSIS